MDREALHMEKTMTLITRLFVLGTSIKYCIAQCTLELCCCRVYSILIGEGGKGVQR